MTDPRRPVLTRLLLELFQLSMRAYFPHGRTSASMIIICCALRAAGRPLTAAEVCRAARLPRATCLRRLAQLLEKGAVDRIGCRYQINSDFFASKHPVKLSVEAVQRAAAELSKLDK